MQLKNQPLLKKSDGLSPAQARRGAYQYVRAQQRPLGSELRPALVETAAAVTSGRIRRRAIHSTSAVQLRCMHDHGLHHYCDRIARHWQGDGNSSGGCEGTRGRERERETRRRAMVRKGRSTMGRKEREEERKRERKREKKSEKKSERGREREREKERESWRRDVTGIGLFVHSHRLRVVSQLVVLRRARLSLLRQ